MTQDNKAPLPHNEEAERRFLGAILLSNNHQDVGEALSLVTEAAFFKPANKWIFRALLTLYNQNKSLETMTVAETLRSLGQLDNIGGTSALLELQEEIYSIENIKTPADIINDKARRRLIMEACAKTMIRGDEGDETTAVKLLDELFTDLFAAEDTLLQKKIYTADELAVISFKNLQDMMKSESGIDGVPTGFSRLDDLLGGLKPKQLIILGASTSVGKSALALNIANNACVAGHPTLYISLEMGAKELMLRQLAFRSGISPKKFRKGGLTQREIDQLVGLTGVIASEKMCIDDDTSRTPSQLKNSIRKFKRDHDIKLVVIDYLALMNPVGRYGSQYEKITAISRFLKQLACELDIPFLVLSQLSREVDKRTSGKPQLSDLRDSGAVGQDADTVLFLWRPNPEDKASAQVIVAKQRCGPLGHVNLLFNPELTLFTESFDDGDFAFPSARTFANNMPQPSKRNYHRD